MYNSDSGYLVVFCVIAAAHTAATRPAQADQQAAEKEIRTAADSFVESFRKRDAAAIASHWTIDGVYINEEDERFEGRQSIQSEYQTLFENSSDDLELRLEIDSIRFINAQTAIEEGRAALMPQPPGESRIMSRYTAVHVKQDGRWLMKDVRDTRVELPPDAGQLEDLGWLVGTWGASKGDSSIEVVCRWIENNRFLLRKHAVTESGKETAGGLDVIGMDPSSGRITSWNFTRDGGHAVGVWTPLDGSWAVQALGVMQDGTETTATYNLSRTEDDALKWKSIDRMLGDTLLPDLAEIVLKRK